ncbi:MAG: hypothetical protein M3275_00355 [Thermoproteota archaeon]|nr:hypothetical protein [Thermoproteota archaeon]MDQ3966827.1 hypothetical protein [Thermoproteota archaeon]
MSSQEASDNKSLPDLTVNQCLFGCEGCPGVWTNRQIGHSIICRCVCGHGRIRNNEHENVSLQGPRIRPPTAQAEACASKPSAPEFNHDGEAVPVRTSAGLMDLAESTSKASVDVVDRIVVDGESRSSGK